MDKSNIRPLEHESPIAASPAKALLWWTVKSVSAGFWLFVAIIIFFTWNFLYEMPPGLYFFFGVFYCSYIGYLSASANAAEAMEFDSALPFSPRRKFLIQAAPGLIASLVIGFLPWGAVILQLPEALLSLAGVSADSPTMNLYNSWSMPNIFWSGVLPAACLTGFTASYVFNSIYARGLWTRRFGAVSGLAFVLLCVFPLVVTAALTFPVDGLGPSGVGKSGGLIVALLDLALASAIFLAGYWKIASSDRTQNSGRQSDTKHIYIVLAALLGCIIIGGVLVSHNRTAKSTWLQTWDNCFFGINYPFVEAEISLRSKARQTVRENPASNYLDELKKERENDEYYMIARRNPERGTAIWVFLIGLGLLAFLNRKYADSPARWGWKIRTACGLGAVLCIAYGVYVPNSELNRKSQQIEEALRAELVAPGEYFPEPPKPPAESGPANFPKGVKASLNMIMLNPLAFTPLCAKRIELTLDHDGTAFVYSPEPAGIRDFAGDQYHLCADSRIELPFGDWRLLNGTWFLEMYRYDLVVQRYIGNTVKPFAIRGSYNFKHWIKPQQIILSNNYDNSILLYWITFTPPGTEPQLMSVGEFMNRNAVTLSGEIRSRGIHSLFGSPKTVASGSFFLPMTAAVLLAFLALRGRFRADYKLVALVLLGIAVAVWTRGFNAARQIELLRDNGSGNARRLAAVDLLSENSLDYPETAAATRTPPVNTSPLIAAAMRNLHDWIKLEPNPEPELLPYPDNWVANRSLNYNSLRRAKELCDWADASDKRTFIAVNASYAAIFTRKPPEISPYAFTPKPVSDDSQYLYSFVRSNFGANYQCFGADIRLLPPFAQWESISGFPPDGGLEMIFTVKPKFVQVCGAEPDKKYRLMFSNEEARRLFLGDIRDRRSISPLLKAWFEWRRQTNSGETDADARRKLREIIMKRAVTTLK
jgi:hypothetical protein